MHELDPVEYEARGSETTRRREYFVPFVNSVWHMDGHHKLIDWKIVIHGAIDGKSHVVTFMYASDNNRADTVRGLFLGGTQQWGWPQRVRVDHGGENLGVKLEMELRRGEGRGSFIQGGSTHNQRIERLWVDVRRGVVDKYRKIFERLQDLDLLNNKDALHLYCLHHVYLTMINKSLKMWVASWNNHGMSASGLGGMTPLGQWYMGGIAARRNGFHIEYRPWPSEEEEERLWQEYLEGVRLMDAAEYRVRGQGAQQERRPTERDPHVHVGRFAESLPPVLYSTLTIAYIEKEFGPPGGIEADDGMGRYAAL
ncbi:hypothetical protein QFC20_006438 [Naganishia adeliensis]|uniref:Uncharacterized protein n=1 Tax=Naganishia adeliensis TaxID=92952 RepID=A0ACC2VBJ3_9TREE|nr:hypothetical protein QFC20_006438 [Naganishia adeliensis]